MEKTPKIMTIDDVRGDWMGVIGSLLKSEINMDTYHLINSLARYILFEWHAESCRRAKASNLSRTSDVQLVEFQQIIEQRRHRAIGSIVATVELFRTVASGSKFPTGWPEFLASQLKERCLN